MRNIKLKVEFKTITEKHEIIYTREEVKGSDLEKLYNHLIALMTEGVESVIYDLPTYGKVKASLIENNK